MADHKVCQPAQGKLQEQWLHLKQTCTKQGEWLVGGESAILKLLKEAAALGAGGMVVEVSLFRAEAHLEAWRRSEAAASKRSGVHDQGALAEQSTQHAAAVWQIIAGIWNGKLPGEPGQLTESGPDKQSQAAQCLAALGFQDTAKLLHANIQRPTSRASSSKASSLACSQSIFR